MKYFSCYTLTDKFMFLKLFHICKLLLMVVPEKSISRYPQMSWKNNCFQIYWKSRWPGRQNILTCEVPPEWVLMVSRVIIIYQILPSHTYLHYHPRQRFWQLLPELEMPSSHSLFDGFTVYFLTYYSEFVVTTEYNWITDWTLLIIAMKEINKIA